MPRIRVEVFDRRLFDDETGVHHDHAIRQPRHHAQVVRDPDDGHPDFVPEAFDEVGDLGLDRHIQRGRRLIGDQELRVAAQAHGDHHALAHAAGELVRVVVEPIRCTGDADQFKQFDRAFAGGRFVHPHVQNERFGNLKPDGEDRVQRGHRILEDHGDLIAAHLPDFIVRNFQQVFAIVARPKQHLAAGNLAGRLGDQPHQ